MPTREKKVAKPATTTSKKVQDPSNDIRDLENDKVTKTVMIQPAIPIPNEGITVRIDPTKVDDTPCISISEFAFLMGWTVQNVYYHINQEDPKKRIKSKKIFRTLFVIPYSEYLRLSASPLIED